MKKIIKQFDSKKNNVCLMDINGVVFVRKNFRNNDIFNTELAELKSLQSLNIPKILNVGDCYIDMEYINGNLFLNEYLNSDLIRLKNITVMLSDFIKSYRKLRHNFILNDENFRNYIIKNDSCYRVDFEDITIGSIEEWISKLICFAILYDTDFERLHCFSYTFTSAFNISLSRLYTIILNELNIVCNRRHIDVPITVLEKLINNLDIL